MNVGFFGLLGVVFVVLKLTGVIFWSWWLVLLPFYGPALFLILLFVLGCCGLAYSDKMNKFKGDRK